MFLRLFSKLGLIGTTAAASATVVTCSLLLALLVNGFIGRPITSQTFLVSTLVPFLVATPFIYSHFSLLLQLYESRETIQRREAEISSLMRNVPGMVYHGLRDWSAEILSGSREVTGYSPEEITGMQNGWLDVVHPDDRKAFQEESRELEETKESLVQQYRIVDREGKTRWVEDRKRPVFTEEGSFIGVDGILYDVTSRVLAKERLQQTQRAEAIGTLARGIAHDLNNLLTPITGYAELLQLTLPPGGKEQKYVKDIAVAGRRSIQLVKQILTFSRQGKREHRSVPVPQLAAEMKSFLRATIPATIEIRDDISFDAGHVQGDASQIQQVILNLCTNASQAMEEGGGVLDIAVYRSVTDEGAQADDDADTLPRQHVCIEVRDTGTGMDPETEKRIFEPYFTTRPQRKGTGLGLSVVHGIVKDHGGFITVESRPGTGTTFRVYLPRITADMELTEAESVDAAPMGEEHLLLVDDETAVLETEREILQSLGYRVTAATSGEEALRVFRDAPDLFDLAITDLTMPGMTGVELSRELLALNRDLPVIICTGYSDTVDMDGDGAAGIHEFVDKPMSRKAIAGLLRRILDGRP
jgi:PAS domain S-box-containing protein